MVVVGRDYWFLPEENYVFMIVGSSLIHFCQTDVVRVSVVPKFGAKKKHLMLEAFYRQLLFSCFGFEAASSRDELSVS